MVCGVVVSSWHRLGFSGGSLWGIACTDRPTNARTHTDFANDFCSYAYLYHQKQVRAHASVLCSAVLCCVCLPPRLLLPSPQPTPTHPPTQRTPHHLFRPTTCIMERIRVCMCVRVQMLTDHRRMAAYHDAIIHNAAAFQGRTVVDVGTGTYVKACEWVCVCM